MSIPHHAPDLTALGDDRLGGRPVRWGLIGLGQIAHTFAQTLSDLPGHQIVAVAATDPARAADFADRYGVPRHHGEYAGVFADPEVDVVYVATTHPHHLAPALAAVAAGKAVLVEKPLGLNATEAGQLFEAAQSNGVFAMEAMWMRTQPLVREVERLVGEGEIGDLVRASAEIAIRFDPDPGHRLFDLDNGGGSLLDLGVYAAAFCWLFLGEPESVHVMGSLAGTGADHVVAMQWGYDSGAVAQLFCSSRAQAPGRAALVGRRGWIELEGRFWEAPEVATVHVEGQEPRRITLPSRGFAHEADEVARCLRAGLLESPLVPHADTIGVLEILDAARSELGVRYPQEEGISGARTGDAAGSEGRSARNGS